MATLAILKVCLITLVLREIVLWSSKFVKHLNQVKLVSWRTYCANVQNDLRGKKEQCARYRIWSNLIPNWFSKLPYKYNATHQKTELTSWGVYELIDAFETYLRLVIFLHFISLTVG